MPSRRGPKPVFGLNEAARLTGLSATHLRRLFDRGELAGFRVPCSTFRRVSRATLAAFVVRHKLPVHPELAADVAADVAAVEKPS